MAWSLLPPSRMNMIEGTPNPAIPLVPDRRRNDRRSAGGPDLARPEAGLRPLPSPRPTETRLHSPEQPQGDFRVDPEA